VTGERVTEEKVADLLGPAALAASDALAAKAPALSARARRESTVLLRRPRGSAHPTGQPHRAA